MLRSSGAHHEIQPEQAGPCLFTLLSGPLLRRPFSVMDGIIPRFFPSRRQFEMDEKMFLQKIGNIIADEAVHLFNHNFFSSLFGPHLK